MLVGNEDHGQSKVGKAEREPWGRAAPTEWVVGAHLEAHGGCVFPRVYPQGEISWQKSQQVQRP